MLQKLKHKLWMNLCLLLGSILLIATVVSFPLYQTAAYDRMLQDEFQKYIAMEGKWPTINSFSIVSQKERNGATISRMEGLMESVYGELGVTEKETVSFYTLTTMNIRSELNRQDAENASLKLGALSDLPAHAKMLSGEMFSESGLTEDGCIEVVMSQSAMVNLKLLVGETIVFSDLRDTEGKEIRMYVKGVFDPVSSKEEYWQVKPEQLNNSVLMNLDLFRSMFTGEKAGKYTVSCSYYTLFGYEGI